MGKINGRIVVITICVLSTLFIYQNCSNTRFEGINLDASGALNKSSTAALSTEIACRPDEVAVGLTNSLIPICAPTTSRIGTHCPIAQTVIDHSDLAGVVSCVDVNAYLGGNACPIGYQLISFETNGTLYCEKKTDYECASGSYLLGIANNSATCQALNLPPQIRVAKTCRLGERLKEYSITNDSLTCENLNLDQLSQLECPSGEALVGHNNGQAVCQPILNNLNITDRCPNLATHVTGVDSFSNQVNCSPLAIESLSHHCPSGTYLVYADNNGLVCRALNNLESYYDGSCPERGYITGYFNGQPICQARNNNIDNDIIYSPSNNCLPGNFALGVVYDSTGVYKSTICSPFKEQMQTCFPGSQRSCMISNGIGSQTCETNGVRYSACSATTCDPNNFNIFSGACVPAVCDPGSKSFCSDSSGQGEMTCNNSGTGYDTCIITNCNSGFVKVGNNCEDQTNPIIDVQNTPQDGPDSTLTIQYTIIDSSNYSVNCQFNNAPLPTNQCTNTAATLSSIPDGDHELIITATDSANNSTSTTLRWTKQTCTPNTQLSCTIGGNKAGVKTCNSQGTAYGTCLALCSQRYGILFRPHISIAPPDTIDDKIPFVILPGNTPAGTIKSFACGNHIKGTDDGIFEYKCDNNGNWVHHNWQIITGDQGDDDYFRPNCTSEITGE